MPLLWPDLPWTPRLLQASKADRVIGWLIIAGCLTYSVNATAAQATETFLSVQREPGSEICPDADAVFRAMQTLYPERAFHRVYAAEQAVASAQVVVRPTLHGHEATLRTPSARPGQRVIVEQDASCRGLGDALAVALSMLLDASSDVGPSASGAPPTPLPMRSAPASAEPEVIVPPTVPAVSGAPKASATPHQTNPRTAANDRASTPWGTHVRAGGLANALLLTQPSLGFVAGGDLLHASGFGLELTAVGFWAQPAKAAEGSIAVSRYGARLGVCYEKTAFARSKYFVCAEFGVGSQRARTSNFTVVFDATRYDAWSTLGPKLGVVHALSGWLHGFVSVGVPINLMRNNLVVAGDPSLRVEAQLLGISAEMGIRLTGPRF